MNLSKRKVGAIVGVGAVAGALALGVAANQAFAVDELRTESRAVDVAGAGSAHVAVEMGVGELELGGGANAAHLIDAGFSYNVDGWQPDVTYEVVGGRGDLRLRQPDDDTLFRWWQDVENRWDVRLNDTVPTDLDVTLGVGESVLRLGGVNVTDLDVDADVGDATIDLSGG